MLFIEYKCKYKNVSSYSTRCRIVCLICLTVLSGPFKYLILHGHVYIQNIHFLIGIFFQIYLEMCGPNNYYDLILYEIMPSLRYMVYIIVLRFVKEWT